MGQSTMSIIMLVAIVAIMYFLMIRPQKKKEKEINAMRNSIQIGDEIVTIGGFCGRVVKTKDESIVIQLGADKTKVEIMRWGISKVVESTGTKHEDIDDIPVKKPSRPKRMKAAVEEEAPVVKETPVAEEAPAAEEAPVEE